MATPAPSTELAVASRLALVGSVCDQGVKSTRYFDVEADYLNSHGLTARFFEPDDPHEAWDCPLAVGGRP